MARNNDTGDECRISELERFIADAPHDPGPMAPGLKGWTRGDALSVCSHCAGRIMARGFGTAFKGWTAVFAPEPFRGCDLRDCGF